MKLQDKEKLKFINPKNFEKYFTLHFLIQPLHFFILHSDLTVHNSLLPHFFNAFMVCKLLQKKIQVSRDLFMTNTQCSTKLHLAKHSRWTVEKNVRPNHTAISGQCFPLRNLHAILHSWILVVLQKNQRMLLKSPSAEALPSWANKPSLSYLNYFLN